MPRAGLTAADVVQAAADIADERGYQQLTIGLVAARLGIRAPSVYKHVSGLAELQHQLATRAMAELGDAVAAAVAGRAGRDALAGLARACRDYVAAHPGRYAATVGAGFAGPGDPLLAASTRVIELIAAVLRGYDIPEPDLVHAIRTVRCVLHGWCMLQLTNAFQWSGDVERSFEQLISFMDYGLRGAGHTDPG
jgi:AcrR family transcriptional regulator